MNQDDPLSIGPLGRKPSYFGRLFGVLITVVVTSRGGGLAELMFALGGWVIAVYGDHILGEPYARRITSLVHPRTIRHLFDARERLMIASLANLLRHLMPSSVKESVFDPAIFDLELIICERAARWPLRGNQRLIRMYRAFCYLTVFGDTWRAWLFSVLLHSLRKLIRLI